MEKGDRASHEPDVVKSPGLCDRIADAAERNHDRATAALLVELNKYTSEEALAEMNTQEYQKRMRNGLTIGALVCMIPVPFCPWFIIPAGVLAMSAESHRIRLDRLRGR